MGERAAAAAQYRAPQPRWQGRATPQRRGRVRSREEASPAGRGGGTATERPARSRPSPEEGGRPARASAALPQPRRRQEAPQGHLQPGCCSPAAAPLLLPPANFAEGVRRRVVAEQLPPSASPGLRGRTPSARPPPRRRSPPRRTPRPFTAPRPLAARRDGRRRLRRLPRQPRPAPPARGRPRRAEGTGGGCGLRPSPPRSAPSPSPTAAQGGNGGTGLVRLCPGGVFCPPAGQQGPPGAAERAWGPLTWGRGWHQGFTCIKV